MLHYDIATRYQVDGTETECALLRNNRLVDTKALAQAIAEMDEDFSEEETLEVLQAIPEVFVTAIQQGHGVELCGVFEIHLDNAESDADLLDESTVMLDSDSLEQRLVEACGVNQQHVIKVLQHLPEQLLALLSKGDVVKLDGVFEMRWRVDLEPFAEGDWEDVPFSSFPYFVSVFPEYQFGKPLLRAINAKANAGNNKGVHVAKPLRVSEVAFNFTAIPYNTYPVPVRIEFVDAQDDDVKKQSAVRYLDFGDGQFEDAKQRFHWQVGAESVKPENEAWATVEAGEAGYQLSLLVDNPDTPLPAALQTATLETTALPSNKMLYRLSATDVNVFVPLLNHFVAQLQCGVWKQDGLTATLFKPKTLINHEATEIPKHFVNILLSWGSGVIARAQQPDAQPPLPEWKNPLGLNGIGVLNENARQSS